MKKRTVSELGYPIAAGVLHAIELLKKDFGATNYRDSGHTKTSPTWIFELPHYKTEIGVRMNKKAIGLYVKYRAPSGSYVRDLLRPDAIAKMYPRDGKPVRRPGGLRVRWALPVSGRPYWT